MRKVLKQYGIWAIFLAVIAVPFIAFFIFVPPAPAETLPIKIEHIDYPGNGMDAETGMSEKLAHYLEKNADVVGLLSLEGTLLESPVVRSDPEDAYMRKNLDGEYHIAGTPFLAQDSAIGADGANLIIYGHNMPDGTVFGALMGYKELDFMIAHPVILFESELGVQSFQVVSVFYADAADVDFVYADYPQLDSDNGREYLRQIQMRSLYDIPFAVSPSDQYITLSTCTYEAGGENGRLVVVGRMMLEGEEPVTRITRAEDPEMPQIFKGRV